MSSIEIKDPTPKGFIAGYVKDAVFCYTQIQKSSFKYQDKVNKEYAVQLVVDEDTADIWKEKFRKNTIREIKTSEFEDKFGIAPPYPEEKKQYVLSLKADAQDHDGEEIEYEAFKRPKVYTPSEDGSGVKDITLDILVGNGSKGDAAFYVLTNDFGTFPKLTGINVKELIEYEAQGGQGVFGNVVNTPKKSKESSEDDSDTPKKTKKTAKKAKPPKVDAPDVDEDDIPF